MKSHLQYLRYVCRHKWFVFRAGLKTGAPLWRLVIHDWSKFTPAEWNGYRERFFSGRAGQTDKSADPEAFHRAWSHHWHLNPHHWEHWLTAEGEPLRMPEKFVREMVADWLGAGRAITGEWNMYAWWTANNDRIKLHPETWGDVYALIESREIDYGNALEPAPPSQEQEQ